MASNSSIKYYVVDAFSKTPFHGNPAAVCILEEEKDEGWYKSVAREFNLSATCYLTKIVDDTSNRSSSSSLAKYGLRWFAPAVELNICGHGTLAAAYVVFETGMVKDKKVEFHIKSGKVLVAERIIDNDNIHLSVSVGLIFPLIPIIECDSSEKEVASTFTTCTDLPINVVRMSYEDELIVEYSSGKIVADLCPSINEIQKWRGRGVVITGAAPKDSGFDFFSRFFCPNLGMIEDPVCGSIHCGVAPYWSKKLGKKQLKAYMASPRGGELELYVDEEKQQVLIQGKASVVMQGYLFH